MKRPYTVYIDVVNRCNLRCPSCPRGDSRYAASTDDRKLKFIEPEKLHRILSAISSQCTVERVALYNWAEPLLHPELPGLVARVKELGLMCDVSSNLNAGRDIPGLVAAAPSTVFASLSGWTQETYGGFHRGGRIEVVKRNLEAVAAELRRTGSDTRLVVLYHQYRNNAQESEAVREYAAGLGAEFLAYPAFFAPVEKLLDLVGGGYEATPEERHVLDNLIYSPFRLPQVPPAVRETFCALQEQSLSVDVHGRVSLCCATFTDGFVVGDVLEDSLEEIQARRDRHPYCSRCKAVSANMFYTRMEKLMEVPCARQG